MNQASWIDLSATSQPHQELQADVCIVGAGAAGIYLTLQLARQGLSVVLLEAGPAICTDAESLGFGSFFSAAPYPGATVGRFFGMGGSTSRWGGLLVPHTAHDLRAGAEPDKAWVHIVDTVNEKKSHVLQQLGYRNGPDFDEYAARFLGEAGGSLREFGIDTQAALILPFGLKNLVRLLDHIPAGVAPPRVFHNAVVESWTVEVGQRGDPQIANAHARSRNHKTLAVRASKFVIAAGAIESARILLEINESASQPVLTSSAAIGCNLADHLSVSIADVAPESLGSVVQLFAPRFSGAWMRSFRFLERSPAQNAPRAFAHFIFSNPGRAHALAKEALGAIQARRIPSVTLGALGVSLGDLMQLAYGRFVKSKLFISEGVSVHLQLDMEQVPTPDNRVSLLDHKDIYGRRAIRINWRVSDSDLLEITKTASRFLAVWPDVKAGLPGLKPRFNGSDGIKPYDVYHPVGTCRMGVDALAVVDLDLKAAGVQNLWVSSTGVLPSAGTANPTFTMLCLTHRLAENFKVMR